MLFPLLLSLSQRVAGLLSAAMLGLVALIGTLLFAKKAFLLSAAALAIAAWDANRKKGEHTKEIHVHRVPVYKEYHPEHYETHEESYKSDYLTPDTDYGTSANQNYGVSQSYSSTSQNYGTGIQNYDASNNYSGVDSKYGGAISPYGGPSTYKGASHYAGASSNYIGATSNYGDTSSNYGSASQKYNVVDKTSALQQFSPSLGVTDRSHYLYGSATKGISHLPYRSPYRYYRYRKGRDSRIT